jgi:DNA-directed RNA polymerase subunit RPC12/RpoP
VNAVWSKGKNMQDEEEKLTEAKLRCVCGYRILCEVRPWGERIGFLAFFDDEAASGTYGQQVESCPGCGEQLGLPLFFRRN